MGLRPLRRQPRLNLVQRWFLLKDAEHEIRIRRSFGIADSGGRYLGHPQRIPERCFQRCQGGMDAGHHRATLVWTRPMVLSRAARQGYLTPLTRSEEHTSELQ